MALLDELTATTLDAYADINKEILLTDDASCRMLLEDARRDKRAGKNITVPVRYKRLNGGWYTGYDKFDTSHVKTHDQIVIPWRNVWTGLTIDEDTLLENAGMNIQDLLRTKRLRDLPAIHRETIVNIVGDQMDAAVDDMKNLIAKAIYSDGSSDDGKQLDGFEAIIDNTSASYGGKAAADFGTFDKEGVISGALDNIHMAKVSSNAGVDRALDLTLISQVVADCRHGGKKVTQAFLDKDLYDALQLLLEGQKIYEDAKVAEIGFEHIKWNGQGAGGFDAFPSIAPRIGPLSQQCERCIPSNCGELRVSVDRILHSNDVASGRRANKALVSHRAPKNSTVRTIRSQASLAEGVLRFAQHRTA